LSWGAAPDAAAGLHRSGAADFAADAPAPVDPIDPEAFAAAGFGHDWFL
jgi:hypothetical protein